MPSQSSIRDATAMSPVLLCGLGRIGGRVLDLLRAAGLPVVVVDVRADPADPKFAGVTVVRGDCREPAVLERAGVRSARAVLVVTSDDLVNTSSALAARRLNREIRIVVRMFNPGLLDRLAAAVGNATALSVSALTAPLIAHTAMTGELLGAFDAADGPRQIARMTLSTESRLTGRPLAGVMDEFRVLPLALEVTGGAPELLQQVRTDHVLRGGDSLVVCGPPAELSRLIGLANNAGVDDLFSGVQWAGRVRRLRRVVSRALQEIDPALLICTLILLVVVLSSTITYAVSGMSASLPDGLYRTISVIATGADMKADRYEGWQKIFVSSLRVSGLILTAAFTAIFTNFLLRARLGGALEERRIPEGGHIVVCGLGHVGFRVVEELLRLGEQVVVVERAADNPLIVSVRRMGCAVVAGDATVTEVLRQARVATARAVVAASSNDLANLEIAMLARELNPKQRVVVRLADDALGETLREVAAVRLAVSLPELAAPAFVAALYGDRVHSLFRANRRMLAAVELTVQPDDPCLKDQSLRALAIDFNLLPIVPHEQGRRLKEGESLTAVATLKDLERLFRRQPPAAEWAVELLDVPPMACEQVATLVRVENGLSADETQAALNSLPLRIGPLRSQGQAEELAMQFRRERAECRIMRTS